MGNYEKPVVETEEAFETLAAGCTLIDLSAPECNPAFDPTYTLNTSL